MRKIAIVYGTRPEFLKLIPLIFFFKKQNVNLFVINTGQHADLLLELEKEFETKADVYLDLQKRQYVNEGLLAQLLIELSQHFRNEKIEKILAQGDTYSVLACAISAFMLKLKFYHIEAGLRTYNTQRPFPEEFNRRVASLAAYKHFAPSKVAVSNLIQERIAASDIIESGNAILDTLKYTLKEKQIKLCYNNQIFITTHRRENLGQPLIDITLAIKYIASVYKNIKFIWSLHPNQIVQDIIASQTPFPKNIAFVNPLNYVDAVSIMAQSKFIISDSGGIQEEVPTLKKRIIILRNETERPEIIECGCGFLVGTDTQKIIDTFDFLINNYVVKTDKNPFDSENTLSLIFNEVLK